MWETTRSHLKQENVITPLSSTTEGQEDDLKKDDAQ